MFVLVALSSTYITFAPAVMPLYSTLIFHPFIYPHGHYDEDTIDGIRREEVTFAGPHGTKLNGWYFKVPGAKKTILFHHGQGGNLTHCLHWARKFVRTGVSFFIYDYEGYGKSTGTPTRDGIVDDAESAYNFVVQDLKVPPESVVDCGFSLGTGVASAIAAKHYFAGVILLAPYMTLKQAALDMMPFLNAYPPVLWPQSNLGSWEYVASPHPPLLIIHGVKDNRIAVLHSDLLFKRATDPKTYIKVPEAGHDSLSRADLQDGINKFLQSLK